MGISKLKNLATDIVERRRASYLAKKRRRNHNHAPTIIANNCVGGVMYHDLGLRFTSPTINLFFPKSADFFAFVDDIEYFVSQTPTQVYEEGKKYPIGEFSKDGRTIRVDFMHYKTFDEAVSKWQERGKRIDYDNIFVVVEYPEELRETDEAYKNFKNVKYKNKRMITNPVGFTDSEIVKSDLYDDKFFWGKILRYKSKFSQKRYLDDFDYVSFLNGD